MKHFLVHYTRVHGEFEDGDKFLLKAGDQTEAETRAKEIIKDEMGSGIDEWEDDVLDCFDAIITLDEVTEVPETDAQILEKYL